MRMKEKDWEQAVEEKILQKSLTDGANQCQAAGAERCQRFGEAFVRGDAIAMSELKDIMVKIQTEVISALQIRRAVENATLDLSSLNEAVIINKANALRAMHGLCQRTMTATSGQQHLVHDTMRSPVYARRPGSHRSHGEEFRGSLECNGISTMKIPSAVSLPDAPIISERSPTRMNPRIQFTGAAPRRSLTRSLKARSSTWFHQIRRLDNNETNDLQEKEEEDEQRQVTSSAERINRISLHDSAVGSSIAASRHKPSTSIASSAFDLDELRRVSCETADSFEQPEEFYKDCSTAQQAAGFYTSPKSNSETGWAAVRSRASLTGPSAFPRIASPPPAQWESPDDILHTGFAPRAVTTEAQPAFEQHHEPRFLPPSIYPPQSIHPAFRNRHIDGTPVTLAPPYGHLYHVRPN